MSDDAKAWQEGLKRYLRWVEGQHSTMRLLGQPRPVPLEGIFTDVYVLDKPSASHRMKLETLQQHYEEREVRPLGERQSGMEMVQREPRLFILGKPGAGKTTFLRYVALQAARRKSTNRIPIFVSLKEVADSGQDLLTFMIEQVAHLELPDAAGFVKILLKAGRGLVLLDGLDEAQQANFDLADLILDINLLTSRYPKSQYLITCRPASMEYQFDRFVYVEMADFTQPQIESFVGKWFATHIAQGRPFLEELAKPDHRGLKELAQVPLLLTLLCLTFEETQSFPERRVEVYSEAVEALLKRWDASRGIRRDEVYKYLSYDRKRQMLAYLAFDTFERGHYFIQQAELEAKIVEWLRQLPTTKPDEEINGGVILKAIEAQHGLFVERAREIYSFAHLSFQEYFTAKYLVETEGILPFLMTKITEPHWREVFLLVASLLPNANLFFDEFLAALDKLVVDQPPIVELLEWAERKAESPRLSYKGEALRAIYLGRDHTHNRATDLAQTLAFTPIIVYVGAHTYDLHLARNRSLNLAHKLDQDLNRDLGLVFKGGWREEVKQTFIVVAEGVINLNDSVLREKSENLANNLQHIISTERQPRPDWHLSHQEARALTDYLTATQLLIDCLAVAIVSDREGIKARLLRPPAPKTKPPAHE